MSTIRKLIHKAYIQQAILLVVCLLVLLRTMAPTVFELDSAEFATGAAILGIVHAPGYPLFTAIAHLFTLLPVGDVAYRVNLFSAVSLALTAPIFYSLLTLLIANRRVAFATTLLLVWSYYVWNSGTAAEIYAPQLLTVTLCGWSLTKMYWEPGYRGALRTGFLFGLAVAMVPSSVFFAPGIALAFRLMRVPWRTSICAALIGVAVVLVPLVYLPLRYAAYPEFNKMGLFDASGTFHSFNFESPAGIWEAISAEQFRALFFSEGLLPTFSRLGSTFSWFWRNFLGIGVVVGLAGIAYLFSHRRQWLICWLGFFVPYTYFYICYGAVDRDTMFGPSHMLWAIVVGFGLFYMLRPIPPPLKQALLVSLPVLALVVNFGAVNLSDRTDVRSRAQTVLNSLPPRAIVAGYWAEVTPLQYLHYVEKQRPDITIYDLFLFAPEDFRRYMDQEAADRPIVFVTSSALAYVLGTPYSITPIWSVASSGQLPSIISFEARRMAVSSR
jgi:hypothetical protein